MKIITRADAIASGKKRYFTGEPCHRGHVFERRVSDWACVECGRLKGRDPKVRERLREYMAAHQRQYRKKHPDRVRATKMKHGHEVLASYKRALRAKNPEPSRAALRKSYQKHKAKRSADARAWKLANPEKHRALQKAGKANRRALEAAAEGKILKSDVLRLFEMQAGLCAADDCRVDLAGQFHLDHMVPLSRGGTNGPENAQLLCAPCNLSKNAKTMDEWMAWKASLKADPAPAPDHAQCAAVAH